MKEISAEEAAAAWSTVKPEQPTNPHYRHYRPLVDAATAFIKEAQDKNRIFTGVDVLDEQMRGIGSGHLCVVTGYSHSGKTQLVLDMLRHNKGKRIAFFIPDEPATLVLSKLASIESGMAARDLEERVAINDAEAIRLLRDTALVDFPNLAVFDKPLIPQVMEDGLAEVQEVWGAKADLVIVDYVDLVQAGESVPAKFDFLKGFGSRHELPLVAIHQTSRSAGAEGRKMTIASGNYGGEQHATFLIGVRRMISQISAEIEELRPKVAKGSEAAQDRMTELMYDLGVARYTITVSLVKNKRPGGTLVDDFDIEIDQETGRLSPIPNGELPRQYQAAVAARRSASGQPPPVKVEAWRQQDLGDF